MANYENKVFISGEHSKFKELGVASEDMGYLRCGGSKREAGAWLYADEEVCDFMKKSQWREEKFYQRHGFESGNEVLLENEVNAQSFPSPEEELMKQEKLAALYEVLDKLTELDREIIELSYYEDMTDAAIGKVVGMSQRGVNKRRHKALAMLRNILEKNFLDWF